MKKAVEKRPFPKNFKWVFRGVETLFANLRQYTLKVHPPVKGDDYKARKLYTKIFQRYTKHGWSFKDAMTPDGNGKHPRSEAVQAGWDAVAKAKAVTTAKRRAAARKGLMTRKAKAAPAGENQIAA